MACNTHWKESERRLLRRWFPYIEARELSELMEGRSTRAINSAAYRMGLRKCHDALQDIYRANALKHRQTENSPPLATGERGDDPLASRPS